MRTVDLVFELIPRKSNLLRVDHHHMIAAVQVGREVRFILPNQYARYHRGYATQNLVRRIDYNPFRPLRQRFRFAAFWNIRPHFLCQHLTQLGTNGNNSG